MLFFVVFSHLLISVEVKIYFYSDYLIFPKRIGDQLLHYLAFDFSLKTPREFIN